MKMGRRPKSQRLLWGNEWERVAARRREEEHLDLHPDRYLQIWICENICQVSGSLNYSFFPPLNWVLPRRCRMSETIRGIISDICRYLSIADIWVSPLVRIRFYIVFWSLLKLKCLGRGTLVTRSGQLPSPWYSLPPINYFTSWLCTTSTFSLSQFPLPSDLEQEVDKILHQSLILNPDPGPHNIPCWQHACALDSSRSPKVNLDCFYVSFLSEAPFICFD